MPFPTVNIPATDAVEVDADSLLRELAPEVETMPADTHPDATPHDGDEESQADKHTVPHKGRSAEPIPNSYDADPTPASTETPPVNET